MTGNDMIDDPLSPEEEALLSRWLRAAIEDEDPAFHRPDEDVIFRFVSGNADEKELSIVRQALLKSKEFRQEMIEIVKEQESIKGTIQSTQHTSTKLTDIPTLEQFEKKFGGQPYKQVSALTKPTLLEILKGSRKLDVSTFSDKAYENSRPVPIPTMMYSGQAILGTLLAKFFRLPTVRVYLPVAAAASLALIFMLGGLGTDRLPYGSVAQSGTVEKSMFVKRTLRGNTARGDEKTFATALEAAADGFSNFITLQDNNYKFESRSTFSSTTGKARPLLLDVRDRDSASIVRYISSIQRLDPAKQSVQAWIITLPSRGLLSLDMTHDSMAVVWAVAKDSMGAVLFTYAVGDSFLATSPVEFKVD